MHALWLMTAILIAAATALPTNPKEKPSIMIGIKRSGLSTTTAVSGDATEGEPSSTTPKLATKKPYSDKFVKVPEKPLSYEKKPADKPKVTEVAKKSAASEVRSELHDEVAVPEAQTDQQIGVADVPDVPDVPETSGMFEVEPKPKENATMDSTTDVYDNSQHGNENYRVHLKGFTFLVAPSETILGAAMLMSGMGEKTMKNTEDKVQRQQESFARLMQILQGFSNKDTKTDSR